MMWSVNSRESHLPQDPTLALVYRKGERRELSSVSSFAVLKGDICSALALANLVWEAWLALWCR